MTYDIGEIMRKIRVDRNLSQEHIADSVFKKDPSSYSRYERGETEPKFEAVMKLASFYKMSIDEFINYGNPDFLRHDPKAGYRKAWSVAVTVQLDGTPESLEFWTKKIAAINKAI